MTLNTLIDKLRSWDVYTEQGEVKTLDLSNKSIEIPCEVSKDNYTSDIIVSYDIERDIVRLLPSINDGRLE